MWNQRSEGLSLNLTAEIKIILGYEMGFGGFSGLAEGNLSRVVGLPSSLRLLQDAPYVSLTVWLGRPLVLIANLYFALSLHTFT